MAVCRPELSERHIHERKPIQCFYTLLASAAGVSVINGEGKTNGRGRGRREKKRNASRQTAAKREKFFELAASGGR